MTNTEQLDADCWSWAVLVLHDNTRSQEHKDVHVHSFHWTRFSGGWKHIYLDSHVRHLAALWRCSVILTPNINVITYLFTYLLLTYEIRVKKLETSLYHTLRNVFRYLENEPRRRRSRVWQTDRRPPLGIALSNSVRRVLKIRETWTPYCYCRWSLVATRRSANVAPKCTLKHVLALAQYPNRCS